MIKINIMRLMSSIQRAPAFTAPEMNDGTGYLFNKIYKPLSNGGTACLSDLDFDAFDLEDIGSLDELFKNVYESYSYKTSGIADTMRKIAPVCKEPFYV